MFLTNSSNFELPTEILIVTLTLEYETSRNFRPFLQKFLNARYNYDENKDFNLLTSLIYLVTAINKTTNIVGGNRTAINSCYREISKHQCMYMYYSLWPPPPLPSHHCSNRRAPSERLYPGKYYHLFVPSSTMRNIIIE